MTYSITRKMKFDAGHRVMEHGSKCRHLHGHEYHVEITAQAPGLDRLGMVVDFSVLKEVVGGWIDRYWDHGFIYFDQDRAVYNALVLFQVEDDTTGEFQQKMFALPTNPTAENMAQYLLKTANELLAQYSVVCTKIVLWETENCCATAELPSDLEDRLQEALSTARRAVTFGPDVIGSAGAMRPLGAHGA